MWINAKLNTIMYYSALIVLFGTRFTYVYAERYGTPIVPGRNMRQDVTELWRAQENMV